MAKSPKQKLKLLYLLKILWENSDDAHPCTMADIISQLWECGIIAERKTIYDDMDALREFGFDIIARRGKGAGYYLAARDFDLPELKLLVDAVQASKFITLRKSNELIKKLEKHASKHEAGHLRRQVHILGRVKTMNEQIYYNVDILHAAIADDRKVGFKYFEYNVDKKKIHRYDEAEYTVCPLALMWDDENYYLIAYHDRYQDISHFRVDKMDNLHMLSEKANCPINKNRFDLAEYSKQIFGMFSGEKQHVEIRFENSLVGVVLDRFGKDIFLTRDGDDRFVAQLHVSVSPVFLSWVFQFGTKAKIISPANVASEMQAYAGRVYDVY